ncbi:MAG: hypothetical protein AABM30_13645 [Actinomycetota bacterium]
MRIGRREVTITNPDKVFFPERGLTKGDLVRYYLDVAPYVLHQVSRRPMQMKRYPDGVDGFFFYQKRVPEPHPDWLGLRHALNRASGCRDTFRGKTWVLKKHRFRALSKPFRRSARVVSRLGVRLREAARRPFVLEDAPFCGIRGLGAGAFMVR